LALAAGLWIAGEHSAGAVTLSNAGFEVYDGIGNVASNWVAVAPTGASGDFQVVSTPVHEGVRAQQFAFSGLTKDQTASIEQTFAIDPGAEYELSGYFNIESLVNAQVQLKIDYYDVNSNLIDSNVTIQTATTSGYTRLQNIRVARTNAVSCKVSVKLLATADGGAGTFTVDQFALRKTNAYMINPGFETYNGMYNVADSWRAGYSPKSISQYEVVNSPVSTGTRAQKVSASGLPLWGFAQVNQMVTAQPETVYTVSGKVKVEQLDNAKVQLYIDYFDADYKFLGSDPGETELTTVTNGYVDLKNETTAPEQTAYLKVWALLRSTADNGSGTFYVDDISVAASADYPPEQPIVDLIPTMTSNTAPLGEVLTTDNVYSYSAYRAFDSTSTSIGTAYNLQSPVGFIGYNFKNRAVVREYGIQMANGYTKSAPKNWTFEGFDGSTWWVLDTRTDVTDWVSNTTKTFSISNRRAFSQYRINVTANNGEPTFMFYNEVFMNGYYAKPNTPQNLWNSKNGDGTVTLQWTQALGVTSYEVWQDGTLVKTLPGSTTTATMTGLTNGQVYHYTIRAINGAGASLFTDEVLAMPYTTAQWLNPVMVNNTAPYGIVESNMNPTNAYRVFDHISAGTWLSSSPAATIDFDFQTPVLIREYTLDPSTTGKPALPKDWTFEGFDGNQWIVLDKQSNVTNWTSSTFKYYTLDNTQVFSKYRLNVTANNGDPSLIISELQLLGEFQKPATPQNLWNTDAGDGFVSLEWRGVAGATSYAVYQDGTKVMTVPAAPAKTLQSVKLTGLQNGRAYANWVTAINAAGESLPQQPPVLAMPFSNAQWLNQPMTSNVSAGGIAWASDNPNNAYHLFDHVTAGWLGNMSTATISYESETPLYVQQYTIKPSSTTTAAPKNWTFEAYTGSQWVVLDKQTNVTNWGTQQTKFFTIGNYNPYKRYRWNITANNGSSQIYLYEIQLLGN
jgi:hypothetical protein